MKALPEALCKENAPKEEEKQYAQRLRQKQMTHQQPPVQAYATDLLEQRQAEILLLQQQLREQQALRLRHEQQLLLQQQQQQRLDAYCLLLQLPPTSPHLRLQVLQNASLQHEQQEHKQHPQFSEQHKQWHQQNQFLQPYTPQSFSNPHHRRSGWTDGTKSTSPELPICQLTRIVPHETRNIEFQQHLHSKHDLQPQQQLVFFGCPACGRFPRQLICGHCCSLSLQQRKWQLLLLRQQQVLLQQKLQQHLLPFLQQHVKTKECTEPRRGAQERPKQRVDQPELLTHLEQKQGRVQQLRELRHKREKQLQEAICVHSILLAQRRQQHRSLSQLFQTAAELEMCVNVASCSDSRRQQLGLRLDPLTLMRATGGITGAEYFATDLCAVPADSGIITSPGAKRAPCEEATLRSELLAMEAALQQLRCQRVDQILRLFSATSLLSEAYVKSVPGAVPDGIHVLSSADSSLDAHKASNGRVAAKHWALTKTSSADYFQPMVEASTTKNVPAASSQRNMFAIEAALASAALPKISKRGRISWLQEDLHSCEKNFESQKANYESNSSSGGEGRPMVAPQNRRNNSRGSPSCTESSIVLSRSNSGTSNALRADTMPRLLRKGQPLISAIISNTCHDHLPPLPAAPTAPHVYSTTSGVPSAGASAGRPHVCVAENPVLHESHRHATESFSFTSTPNALAAQGTSAAGANAYENKSEDSDCVLLELTAHHLQERRRGRQQQQRPVLQQPARESLPLFSWNPQEMVAAAVSAAAGSSSVMNTEKASRNSHSRCIKTPSEQQRLLHPGPFGMLLQERQKEAPLQQQAKWSRYNNVYYHSKGAVVSSAAAVLLAGCARRAAVGGKSASGAVHLRQLVTSRRDQQVLMWISRIHQLQHYIEQKGLLQEQAQTLEQQLQTRLLQSFSCSNEQVSPILFEPAASKCLFFLTGEVVDSAETLRPNVIAFCNNRGVDPPHSTPGLLEMVASVLNAPDFGSLWPSNARWPQSPEDSFPVSGEGDTDDWLLVEPDDDAFEAPFDASHISITDWSAAAVDNGSSKDRTNSSGRLTVTNSPPVSAAASALEGLWTNPES
ncbi:hypothetical protein cyc_07392 [Cyclospora cayetanensis]|uniref:Uncharacterized protein n=1 Tax=Cyclospora cayetanensis TaxID=88456 RepID=A0A1D3CVR9_9EIME|nr:hypothetical protein cyc_07392 [Cyclospora cayetanensis]